MYSPHQPIGYEYYGMNVSLIDRVPQDMVHLIDPHWWNDNTRTHSGTFNWYLDFRYQYPPLPTFWNFSLGSLMIVLGIISWCGNGVVMYVFLFDRPHCLFQFIIFNSYIFSTTKSLRTPSNMLVLNLAFSDFMMMVVQSPPMVINCFYETWALGPMMCDIYAMCGSFFGCTSIWTMCLIAFDRWYCFMF